jgi:hypothetical protein
MKIYIIIVAGILIIHSVHAQPRDSITLKKADSLFYAFNWKKAKTEYEKLSINSLYASDALFLNHLGYCYQNLGNFNRAINLYEKAMGTKPASIPLRQVIYARLAKCYATQKKDDLSLRALKGALQNGYLNFEDLDSAKAFKEIRLRKEFLTMRDSAYYRAFPCMADLHAREFDFWVGEWDAYSTGTNILRGQSVIQRVSGGCLVLENWKSVGSPYSGKSMNFVDSSGKWQQVWVGVSEGSGPNVFTNGEYRDSAMRFIFSTRDNTGKPLKGRFTFFNLGPDKVRQLQETSADEGTTWNTVYDFMYIRRK